MPFATGLPCWNIDESFINPNLHLHQPINEITHIDFQDALSQEKPAKNILHFIRPLTPGETTFVTYGDDFGGFSTGEFHFLPGDVDGNHTVCVEDVQEILDILKGDKQPRWGMYSADMDHSGEIHPADLLRLIDLMNGAGAYEPWLGVSLDLTKPTCP